MNFVVFLSSAIDFMCFQGCLDCKTFLISGTSSHLYSPTLIEQMREKKKKKHYRCVPPTVAAAAAADVTAKHRLLTKASTLRVKRFVITER